MAATVSETATAAPGGQIHASSKQSSPRATHASRRRSASTQRASRARRSSAARSDRARPPRSS
ncbi:hypothetical protein SFUMM280S_07591 [Streptomyces fumanus]